MTPPIFLLYMYPPVLLKDRVCVSLSVCAHYSHHQQWGTVAWTAPAEPSCSGRRWRRWWPYSGGPCLWQPGPADTHSKAQGSGHALHYSQHPVGILASLCCLLGGKWGVKARLIIGAGLGGWVILQSRSPRLRVRFIALAEAGGCWQVAYVSARGHSESWVEHVGGLALC